MTRPSDPAVAGTGQPAADANRVIHACARTAHQTTLIAKTQIGY